jgi:hypothetical protein
MGDGPGPKLGIEVLPFDEKGKKQFEVEESPWKQMA